MKKIDIIKKMWADIYAPNNSVVDVAKQYLHPDYTQTINGSTLYRDSYLEHVISQKKTMTVEHIEYKHSLEDNDSVFSIYYPSGNSKTGVPIKAEVFCHFTFKDNLVINAHGQVRIIEGNPSDVDM